MQRFTRLTNGFSKKMEAYDWTVCLYAVFHSFVRMHKTPRCAPAMAARLSDELWEHGRPFVAMIGAAPTARSKVKI
jgi:hypothetical protein